MSTINETVIAGTRPTGSTPADGTVLWATRRFHKEGRWTFTTYNGWLISSETCTDLQVIADAIQDTIVRQFESASA